MLPTPSKFCLVSGSSEGTTKLNAFDGALLRAGIGNVNLVKLSSILPPGAVSVEKLDIPPGSLVPTAYGYIASELAGQKIAAAVAVGLNGRSFGVIMEHSRVGSAAEAEAEVRAMVEEAFRMRGLQLTGVKVASVEHVVERTGCAFAAVALWY
ncbi:MAG: arginine decarboxylase, pyruvoyl-dependent [Bacillota bacterium]